MTQIRIVRIYNYIQRLRAAIRREGTPAIQEAWDKLEPHVSIFLQSSPEDAAPKSSASEPNPQQEPRS